MSKPDSHSSTHTSLFQPIHALGGELKNRCVLAPLTRARAGESRVPNELMGTYYEQRAHAGFLISEATVISEEAIGWVDSPGIYTDEMTEGWQQITRRVHEKGSKMVLQLWHCGRASHSDFHDGKRPFSASEVKIDGDHIHTPKGKKDYEIPRAMEISDIKRTVEDYKQAALRAKQANFDGVEIHAANGYLLNQFLDGRSNQRTDDYGGTLENRFRFLGEVVDAVLSVWEPENVGVRLSPNGAFNDMGCDDYRQIFTYTATQLNMRKVGYLHVMDGLGFGFHERGEPMTLDEFRQHYDGLIVGNCGYTKETAEAAVAQNLADFIAFGRPFITNPDLPERFKHNWPLAPFDDMSHWYGGGAEGYTDYPEYQESHTNK
ncbi:alkene reductase [Aestuariibacter sp. AA17]|uniref:Alkene reductase n=1 Tax=Fluctibacter corallii TaxID=2984329 RepID=A0ABT3A6F1_9ALTE|nr:alkene reductase [Aestuariibacter sp. AA17]MCV2884195.1 alkene reductase [Aestuariibacter sp. AA17]